MNGLTRNMFQWTSRRCLTSLSAFSPLRSCNNSINRSMMQINPTNITIQPQFQSQTSIFGLILDITQRRWKSRGNTFQPSTLKRKRRVGFLARARCRTGQKILKRRKEKGRWYLTY